MVRASELLEQLNEETVIKILAEHEAPLWKREEHDDHVELIFQTVCHHGHSHKLYWYSNSKKFTCYSHCGVMDIFQLIKQLEGLKSDDFPGSVRYLAEKLGVSMTNRRNTIGVQRISNLAQEIIWEGNNAVEKKRRNYTSSEITKFYDPLILNYFEDDIFYQGWLDEGITEDTMAKYGIRWYEVEKHIIIPHYNIDGKLVGIRRRSLKLEDSNNKYMPEFCAGIMYEHPTGLNLYGLYENKEAIARFKTAVIVEGEKSVLKLDSWYGNKSTAVATCGFKITEWQMKALMKLGVEKVYLGFDKDYNLNDLDEYAQYAPNIYKEAMAYQNKIDSIASKLCKNFRTFIIEDKTNLLHLKDSPMDRGKEVYDYLITHAKQVRS